MADNGVRERRCGQGARIGEVQAKRPHRRRKRGADDNGMVAEQAGQNQENSADKGARRAWAAIGAPPRRLGLAPQSRQWPATIGERPVTRWVCREQATKRPEGPQGLAWHMDRVYSHAGSRPRTDANLANYVSQSNSNCVGFKHLKMAPFPKKLQVKKRSPPGLFRWFPLTSARGVSALAGCWTGGSEAR